MKEKMHQLLHVVLSNYATDVHFMVKDNRLKTTMRTMQGLEEIQSLAFDVSLFNYLKYLSNLDLGNGSNAQSGNFQYQFEGEQLNFRFSLLSTMDTQTGVLRILNTHDQINIEQLSYQKQQTQSFLHWTKIRSGLIVFSGPTGSGKTTTLHAIMQRIASEKRLRAVSLEDPIEIYDDSYLQLQINERNNFNYEEGIRQLLRHDPDVIMIGEIRDPSSAKMLLRSALSGHLIFTTVHAKCCSEAIKRLEEFGLSKNDLIGTLSAVCSQRLYPTRNKKGRVCVYEILEQKELSNFFEKGTTSKSYKDIFKKIQEAVDDGKISQKEASIDLPSID